MSRDFWKFWIAQTVSNLGNSFTQFAFPLLVYKLTESPLNLGIAMAATFLPYLLFGLPLGAWMDRIDRKRAMIALEWINAAVILSVPLVAEFGHLTVWWIYVVTFIQSTIFIAFSAGEFAAIPSLVGTEDLVTANGRIQASYSAAQVVGPLLAGALILWLPLTWVLAFDSASFVFSALLLATMTSRFNVDSDEAKEPTTILHDVREGLRYVLSHPVLRNISFMMALINFVGASTYAQLVHFADERLGTTAGWRIGLLFAAGSAGVVVTGLLAGHLRRRFSFTAVAMTSLMVMGLLTIVFAGMRWYWIALPIWGVASGLGILFNINTGSLRQAIVPNRLLSRVLSIASVLAWSAIPAGALVGGWVIDVTDNVALVYGGIGLLTIVIAAFFRFFTALGDAQRYVDERKAEEERLATELALGEA